MVGKLTRKKTLKDVKQCSPHNKQKVFSCFDKKSLIKMIKSWNKHYRKNRIKYTAKESQNALWNKLDRKMKDKCNNEFCWTSNVGLQGDDKSQLEDMFRPKMPEKWKSHPNEWLNTYDIQRVLRQYEKSRPNFVFIGAVPIDFDYESSPGNCIVNELCNMNVENLLKKGKVWDWDIILEEGAQIVSELNQSPVEMLGHVTSSYFSPNLNKSIALAVVRGGKDMIGKQLFVPMENKNII